MDNDRTRQSAHRKIREDLKAQVRVESSFGDRVADFLTSQFGSMWVLVIHFLFFAVWILYNVSSAQPFDKFPFNLLTMIVSLEAIGLSIIVLISQNRASRLADIREQIDVEIDVRAEEEITKILVMLESIARKLEIPLSKDPELRRMEQRTDISKIRERIEEDQ